MAEVDADGKETGKVISPLGWWVGVYVHREEERAWRRAAKSCIEHRQ